MDRTHLRRSAGRTDISPANASSKGSPKNGRMVLRSQTREGRLLTDSGDVLSQDKEEKEPGETDEGLSHPLLESQNSGRRLLRSDARKLRMLTTKGNEPTHNTPTKNQEKHNLNLTLGDQSDDEVVTGPRPHGSKTLLSETEEDSESEYDPASDEDDFWRADEAADDNHVVGSDFEDNTAYNSDAASSSSIIKVEESDILASGSGKKRKRKSKGAKRPKQSVERDPKAPKVSQASLRKQARAAKGQELTEEGKLKGNTKMVNGKLQFFLNGKWIPAVYHHSIRAQLLRCAARNGEKYTIEPAEGADPADKTAYHRDQGDWGFDLDHRPELLFKWNPTDPVGEKQPDPPFWFIKNGQDTIVLSHEGHPLRQWPGLPLTISGQVEGWRLEAFRRAAPNLEKYELRGRMPVKSQKKGKKCRAIGLKNPALANRQARDRIRMNLKAWYPREGSDNKEYRLLELMPQETQRELLRTNDTRCHRDLTPSEVHYVEKGNRGTATSLAKAGPLLVTPKVRAAREAKNEERAKRQGKLEHITRYPVLDECLDRNRPRGRYGPKRSTRSSTLRNTPVQRKSKLRNEVTDFEEKVKVVLDDDKPDASAESSPKRRRVDSSNLQERKMQESASASPGKMDAASREGPPPNKVKDNIITLLPDDGLDVSDDAHQEHSPLSPADTHVKGLAVDKRSPDGNPTMVSADTNQYALVSHSSGFLSTRHANIGPKIEPTLDSNLGGPSHVSAASSTGFGGRASFSTEYPTSHQMQPDMIGLPLQSNQGAQTANSNISSWTSGPTADAWQPMQHFDGGMESSFIDQYMQSNRQADQSSYTSHYLDHTGSPEMYHYGVQHLQPYRMPEMGYPGFHEDSIVPAMGTGIMPTAPGYNDLEPSSDLAGSPHRSSSGNPITDQDYFNLGVDLSQFDATKP